jgi:hypothetical protein
MRKLLTLWIALAATPCIAADVRHTIDMGDASPDRVVVMGLLCKGAGAHSVSTNGINLSRDVTMSGSEQTAELWTGAIPNGSGETTFLISDCAEPKTIFWRLGDLKSSSPVRTAVGPDAVKNLKVDDCCLVRLDLGDSHPTVAAVYR